MIWDKKLNFSGDGDGNEMQFIAIALGPVNFGF